MNIVKIINFNQGRSILMLLFWFLGTAAKSQTSQYWLDYNLQVHVAKQWTINTQMGYRTVEESKENKWRKIVIAPIAQRTINKHWEVQGGITTAFTLQRPNFNTIEIRPEIGARYHFNPHHQFLVRAFTRIEQRNQYHQEKAKWGHSFRSRFRIELQFPINGKNFSKNNLWYGMADVEAFWVMDKQLDERFANQHRYRVGAGYKLSKDWRFELLYSKLYTRNIISADFVESSDVFRIRIRHFIDKVAKEGK
jgi:hypothetical protein